MITSPPRPSSLNLPAIAAAVLTVSIRTEHSAERLEAHSSAHPPTLLSGLISKWGILKQSLTSHGSLVSTTGLVYVLGLWFCTRLLLGETYDEHQIPDPVASARAARRRRLFEGEGDVRG